jgi:hypothetical protein
MTTNETEMYGAARCPVCFKAPTLTIEAAVWPTLRKTEDYVLRCPLGHPYVAMGDGVQMAVKHWNTYIEFRQSQATGVRRAPADVMLSNCKQCLKYTRSNSRMVDGKLIEECDRCHLIKSVKETE